MPRRSISATSTAGARWAAGPIAVAASPGCQPRWYCDAHNLRKRKGQKIVLTMSADSRTNRCGPGALQRGLQRAGTEEKMRREANGVQHSQAGCDRQPPLRPLPIALPIDLQRQQNTARAYLTPPCRLHAVVCCALGPARARRGAVRAAAANPHPSALTRRGALAGETQRCGMGTVAGMHLAGQRCKVL